MLRICIALLAALVASAAQAQPAGSAENWPSRPIRVVYPFAAGGVGDTSFRLIALSANIPRAGRR